MTTAKREVLIGLLLKNCYSVASKNLWWEVMGVYWGKFWLVKGTSLHHPSRENPV